MVVHNNLHIASAIKTGTFDFSIHPAVGPHVSLQARSKLVDTEVENVHLEQLYRVLARLVALVSSELSAAVVFSRFLLERFVSDRSSGWAGSSCSILKS